MFLMQAVLQRYADAANTAVILLNVKHDDLLRCEPNDKLTEPATALANAWAQAFPGGCAPLSVAEREVHRQHRQAQHSCRRRFPTTFCLRARQHEGQARPALGTCRIEWDTMRALIGEIQNGLTAGGAKQNHKWANVKTWSGLIDGPPLVDPTDGRAQQVGEVAAITVNRFRRILRRIVQSRQSGIFVDQLSRNHCDLAKKIAESKVATPPWSTSTTSKG